MKQPTLKATVCDKHFLLHFDGRMPHVCGMPRCTGNSALLPLHRKDSALQAAHAFLDQAGALGERHHFPSVFWTCCTFGPWEGHHACISYCLPAFYLLFSSLLEEENKLPACLKASLGGWLRGVYEERVEVQFLSSLRHSFISFFPGGGILLCAVGCVGKACCKAESEAFMREGRRTEGVTLATLPFY